ncbi:FCS-Like Zinc finger 3 [Ricinus communis]|uniref:FCS-Like Zinc finger 3 n=1 Tax=Ricinus communis TaxID=3988 RepID=UPI0007729F0B|nr:FCS-Like Zinc finger 3 [Ricinus communis]|eukprot:XP_015578206.1 uncharacterized protein LOC8275428 [Ricinus communis]
MANKRSRPGRSQSFTDIALFDAPPPQPFSELPPDPSALLSNNRLLHNQPRQIVFSALSYSAPLDPRRPNVDFLEICSTCKKWVDHTKDIYMYNDSSFCTQECRNVQIAIDKAAEDARKKAKSKKTSNRGMNR